MKNKLIVALVTLTYFTAFSQGLEVSVHGKYERPLKKEKLENAETMSDLINGYPESWITDYISAEVTATNNGTVMTAMGTNATLTAEQKNILAMADLGTEVSVDVAYRYKNAAIDQVDVHLMNYTATLVPEMEAEYPGGKQVLNDYLKENVTDKISEAEVKKMAPALVTFTINETGEVTNALVSISSGNPKIDKLLLKTITKMPKWKPAVTADGKNVNQDFQFSVGVPGC